MSKYPSTLKRNLAKKAGTLHKLLHNARSGFETMKKMALNLEFKLRAENTSSSSTRLPIPADHPAVKQLADAHSDHRTLS